MNKKQKSLTWKYFRQQKAREVGKFLLFPAIVLLVFLIIAGLGYKFSHFQWFLSLSDMTGPPPNVWSAFGGGCILILMSVLPFFLLWVIGVFIWKLAKERAEKEQRRINYAKTEENTHKLKGVIRVRVK